MRRALLAVALLAGPLVGGGACTGLLAGLLAPDPVAAGERALREETVQRLRDAEALYRDGKYLEALDTYQALEEEGLRGWVLDYNAGNAAFRAGKLGWAVYFYERAARANPRDPDVRHNYRQAREALGLGATAGGGGGLQWVGRWASAYSLDDALRVLVVLLWTGCLLGAATLLRPGLRRISVAALKWVGVLAAVAVLGTGFKLWERSRSPNGVLVAASEVLSAPQEDAQELTRLSAGTLIRRGRRLGGWVEVQAGEDVRGWVEAGSLRRL
jgi:tetratricopeptide (TPR) repeat protein